MILRLLAPLAPLWLGLGAQPPAQPAAPPAPSEPKPVVQAEIKVVDGAISSADDLLSELERADENLRTLKASIVYTKTFATAGDTQERLGTLYFVGRSATGADRKFGIHFDTLRVGSRQFNEPQIYVFDGIWLLEKRPAEKTATKRQIVPAGQKFDPLRIGEGPLPIPIGQRKDDILARYTAELLPAPDGLDPKLDAKLIEFVANAFQLRLVPRADRVDKDKFAEIRLWYRPGPDGKLLPRMARTRNSVAAEDAAAGAEGDETLVRLINVELNVEIPADAADTTTPTSGWDVQIQEYRERKD